MLNYVDFHCHLDLFDNFETRIKEAEDAGIYTLAVTTTPRAWPRNHELMDNLRFVRPALGIHPQLVSDNNEHELKLWDQYLTEAKYIGEVGLDASPRFAENIKQQTKIFKHILLSCANSGGKIISVHAVRSVDATLDMVEEFLPKGRGIIVIHWFTGTPTQAKRAVELGCYFSVNSSMLKSKRSREVINHIPISRLLTETDGPFTSEDFNQLHQIKTTVETLCKLYGTNTGSMTQKILENLKTLTSFN